MRHYPVTGIWTTEPEEDDWNEIQAQQETEYDRWLSTHLD